MGTLQAVAISDVSGVNRAFVTNSGRLLVDLGAASVTVDISGDAVSVSGNFVNVNISGTTVFENGTSLLTGDAPIISSLSGGVFIGSGAVFGVTIRPVSGNSPMWIGGAAGTNVPFSGHGILLYHSDVPLELKVDDVGEIKAFAELSGQRLSWVGTVK